MLVCTSAVFTLPRRVIGKARITVVQQEIANRTRKTLDIQLDDVQAVGSPLI